MKILVVSDEESQWLWDYYRPDRLKPYDLIISCGDLKAEYLRFLVTMARCPVLYVHGNHDEHYRFDPPEGCDCIDGAIVEYDGVRIAGLGGCLRYHDGTFHVSEQQMRRRIFRLCRRLRWLGGVDIMVTHAPPEDLGDGNDYAHRGFAAFHSLLKHFPPHHWLYGHIHLRNGDGRSRVTVHEQTTFINCCGMYELEIPDKEVAMRKQGQLHWRLKAPVVWAEL